MELYRCLSGTPDYRLCAPKENVWSDLTNEECKDVYEFLYIEWNFIYTVEILQPNKSDVLPYLFADQDKPSRWAKVPGRNEAPNLLTAYISAGEFTLQIAENASDITMELLGAKVNLTDPYDPDTLLAFPRITRLEGGIVIGRIQFFRSGMGSLGRTLLPQVVYVKVDMSSAQVSEWKVGEWFYNAISAPDFMRTPPNLDGPWTDTEDFDSDLDGRELPPPVSIQPYGPRYKLSRADNYFYITSTQARGISVFDIRFKGERVMYELGLQEALAHYAGDDPMAGGQEFLDTFFGMSNHTFELLPGYDCPAYADYLDTTFNRLGQSETLPNNICVFEFTSDSLLSRHATESYITASKNTYLTVRSVSTMGNYDYTIDYVSTWTAPSKSKYNNDEYGHRIHEALSSSLHDHVISFKVNLDVAGPSNDMVRLAVEPITLSYPWDKPYIDERNTMHLKEYPVNEEVGLNWPKNSGEFYLVYSADKKNAWGERKGYRITSGTGMGSTPHLTTLNSTTLGNSARWAEKDIWVLRQKDIEPRGADPLNYLSPGNPLVDFTELANHDHHVPHSGGIPKTLMHTSASSIMFVPHNY
ncbi:copper amine oxidase [Xylariales sp. PMI_506]|nr:copper amine oxidase [Xylariales sp. PMI_506]